MSDLVELEVKDKFSKSRPTMNRFLGKAVVAVQRIMDKIIQEQGSAKCFNTCLCSSLACYVYASLHF